MWDSRHSQLCTHAVFDEDSEVQVKNRQIGNPEAKHKETYVQTGFLRINADEAATAIYLPVQRFKKASEAKVYADSRRFI